MKKIIVAVLGLLTAASLTGCMGTGTQLEKVSTAEAPDANSVKASDYKNNLEGLEKYLTALNYIPQKAEATKMMYKVIGAKDGDRYNFSVNNSVVTVELYEYDPDTLGEDGKRVIDEVKKNGEFYVFDKSSKMDENVPYPAVLSDNSKYLVLYTDSSGDLDNVQRKADFQMAVKEFYKN